MRMACQNVNEPWTTVSALPRAGIGGVQEPCLPHLYNKVAPFQVPSNTYTWLVAIVFHQHWIMLLK